MPSNPHVRHKIFSILFELKIEKQIQDDIKKSYITDSVTMIEKQKYDFVKSLHCDDGKYDVGEFRVNDIYLVESTVKKLETHPEYIAFKKYTKYLNEDFVIKTQLLNIDETDDEMFDNLTELEISHLMSIIK